MNEVIASHFPYPPFFYVHRCPSVMYANDSWRMMLPYKPHLQQVHRKSLTVSCQRCTFESTGHAELKRHYIRHHQNEMKELQFIHFEW